MSVTIESVATTNFTDFDSILPDLRDFIGDERSRVHFLILVVPSTDGLQIVGVDAVIGSQLRSTTRRAATTSQDLHI